MSNPIKLNAKLAKPYIWISVYGLKYMKYFEDSNQALEYVKQNPHRCMELNRTVPEDIPAERAIIEEIAPAKPDSSVNEIKERAAEPTKTLPRKARLIYGLDGFSAIIVIPAINALEFGIVPLLIAAAICVYSSAFITARISQSPLSIGARAFFYSGLFFLYFTLSVFMQILVNAIHA